MSLIKFFSLSVSLSEYYFSSDNLIGDFYVRHKMDEQGFVPITLVASFNRIQALSSDVDFIIEAVKDSPSVEIVDNFRVRPRVDPLQWPMREKEPMYKTNVPVGATPVLVAAPLASIPPPPMPKKVRTAPPAAKTMSATAAPFVSTIQATPNASSDSGEGDHSASGFGKSSDDNKAAPAEVSAAVANSEESTETNNNKEDNDSNLWKEVKRRSKQSKEAAGSHDSNSGGLKLAGQAIQAAAAATTTHNSKEPQVSGGGGANKKSAETTTAKAPTTQKSSSTSAKEELDFQFDEELDLPVSSRVNNFSEYHSDDDSDYELPDRDINKILIVTQVPAHRAPKVRIAITTDKSHNLILPQMIQSSIYLP